MFCLNRPCNFCIGINQTSNKVRITDTAPEIVTKQMHIAVTISVFPVAWIIFWFPYELLGFPLTHTKQVNNPYVTIPTSFFLKKSTLSLRSKRTNQPYGLQVWGVFLCSLLSQREFSETVTTIKDEVIRWQLPVNWERFSFFSKKQLSLITSLMKRPCYNEPSTISNCEQQIHGTNSQKEYV